VNVVIPSLVASIFVLSLTGDAAAQARKLSDAELDTVTAGRAAAPPPSVPVSAPAPPPLAFTFTAPAGATRAVEGSGTVQVVEHSGAAGRDTLVIRDQAQQNLQSFINVTAVNSQIQVLVNLNITINSTVGAVQQLNVSGTPGVP
jgi:hypothetical protein